MSWCVGSSHTATYQWRANPQIPDLWPIPETQIPGDTALNPVQILPIDELEEPNKEESINNSSYPMEPSWFRLFKRRTYFWDVIGTLGMEWEMGNFSWTWKGLRQHSASTYSHWRLVVPRDGLVEASILYELLKTSFGADSFFLYVFVEWPERPSSLRSLPSLPPFPSP